MKNSKKNTLFYSWTTPHIAHLKIYFPKLQPDCIINQVLGVNLEHQPGGWGWVLLRHWPACHWMAKCRLLVVVTETKNKRPKKNVTRKQWFPLPFSSWVWLSVPNSQTSVTLHMIFHKLWRPEAVVFKDSSLFIKELDHHKHINYIPLSQHLDSKDPALWPMP